jgi:hypothetical protein
MLYNRTTEEKKGGKEGGEGGGGGGGGRASITAETHTHKEKNKKRT